MGRNALAGPPRVCDGFWRTEHMLSALRSCDMGEVVRAFRTHPEHPSPYPQRVAASWFGVTQARLSRVENGESISNLNSLARWARVLGIPEDLLWFRVPARALRDDGAVSPLSRRSMLTLGTAATLPGLASNEAPTRPGAIRYVTELVVALHRDYQAAKYREAGRALPRVANAVERLLADRHDRRTLALRCDVLVAQAKLATKAGDGAGAYAAAEQALDTAETAEDPVGRATAAYWLTCALLKLADPEEAERNAVAAAEAVAGADPRSLSCRGSLVLIGSIIAARRGDAPEARRRLAHAQRLADRLGRDGNVGFSAFGPTNVMIHRMSVATALDDPDGVLSAGDRLDVDSMPPGLCGRRGQYHLDSAWAHSRRGEPVSAVVHLLEAERVAPEVVRAQRTNRTARALVEELLARPHRRAVPGLRGLAARMEPPA